MTLILFFTVLALALTGYIVSRQKATALAATTTDRTDAMHSRPSQHGLYTGLTVALAGWGALLVLTIGANWLTTSTLLGRIVEAIPDGRQLDWQLVLADARAIAEGRVSSATDELRESIAAAYARFSTTGLWVTVIGTLGAAGLGFWITFGQVSKEMRARNRSELVIRIILFVMAGIAVLTTIGIILSLVFETARFFAAIDWRIDKFLFGASWSPLSGVFEGSLDQDKVGALPLFAGTFLITLIAMCVAVPIGLFAAIYLSDFASKRVRSVVKPLLEILAGIPTVVYGFFAAITLAPFLRDSGEAMGIQVASESALAAGIVMGIMIIPFISSLSDDVINAVPQSLRDGSLGIGATKGETIRLVVLPAALPGIVSAVLLGISRAVGETMIVVMAAGQGANLTANPLEAVTTVTVQIVALITGDTEAETAAGPAFTLGFTLFFITLLMNFAAQRVVRRFRERYE